ncbi:MAG: hypothetical protein DIKNOCCD_03088 [bacterium]|nr:hypothetical protein [bacterium]
MGDTFEVIGKYAGRRKSMNSRAAVFCSLLLAAVSFNQVSQADSFSERGREIIQKNRNAILVVRMIIKGGMSFQGMGSHQEESKTEATGVVIDPNGLTVVPLSETDPYGQIGSLLSSSKYGKKMDIQFKSELTDVKMILDDGKEISGKVVLRDRDLDLAFVRPLEKPAEPMAAIDLTQDATLELLDETLCLDRMTSRYDRVPHVTAGRVKAVVEKPRRYYLVEGTTSGAPVFDLDGRILGINLSTPGSSGDDSDSLMEYLKNAGEMVLPAADIREAASQAPEVDAVPDEPESSSEDVGDSTETIEQDTN